MTIATNRALKFLIVTFGSAGDVHPFIGIGRALKSRGHEVYIATNDYFEEVIGRAGLGFHAIGTKEDFLRLMLNADLWHPTRGVQFVAKESMAPSLEPTYHWIKEQYEPGRTVVLASTLAIGARCAHQKLGVPYATAHLSPAVFRSYVQPVVLPAGQMHRLPAWGVRAMYWVADKLIIDPAVAPVYNGFRKTLGLGPEYRIFRDAMHSPILTLGLFPDWFCPVAPEWPSQAKLTGFPMYDGRGAEPDAEDVARYLGEGEAPVVFTAGSAMRQGEAFFKAAVETAAGLKRRCVILTRFPEQLPPLPGNVRHFGYVPFGQILPRAAAFVHHGGVGSTAQGFGAGVPQLIVHFSHDQPDNAARVTRLGCGEGLYEKRFNAERATPILERLVNDGRYRAAAAEVAKKCDPIRWMGMTCEALEELGRKL
jgi:rhamnosyltransferase subunit B